MNCFAVHLKLTHYKSTTFQLKKKRTVGRLERASYCKGSFKKKQYKRTLASPYVVIILLLSS